MRILISLFSLLVFNDVLVKAQGSINITVTDDRHHPLPGATVYLSGADSATILYKAADTTGTVEFIQLPAGRYRLRASQTGYIDGNSEWIDLEQNNVSSRIILTAKSGLLKDVTVTAKKQFIQFLPDKTVINPEANITNAGATVMDVLEKSPGITVGKDGSIIMKGKPAVMVLIDGKPTQLSGADLQAYLIRHKRFAD